MKNIINLNEIEKALGAIPFPIAYEDWLKIGFALANELGASEAARLMYHYSPPTKGHERETVRDYERMFAQTDGRVKIATLFHIAKQYGYTPPSKPKHTPEPETPGTRETEFPYHDSNGELLYKKIRTESIKDGKKSKTFRFSPKLNEASRRVLYRLPEVLEAKERDETIFFVEGEKDADNLRKEGLTATTTDCGANASWIEKHTHVLEPLHGCKVVVLCDNDNPGREFATAVCNALNGKAKSVKLLDFAKIVQGFPEKGDATDWIEQYNGTREKLLSIVESLSEFVPEKHPLRRLSNNGNEPAPLFLVKPVSAWIAEAIQQPIPRKLFDSFWFENEMCFLFSDTNAGKSSLAVQIADAISKGAKIQNLDGINEPQTVLYFDFEMTAKQFEARYSENFRNHYSFSDRFIRVEMNPNMDVPKGIDFEAYLLKSVNDLIKKTGSKVVIIDNLTYLRTETEEAKQALPLMKALRDIKKENGISMLVLAHTPKRDGARPISQNDMAGSKMLMNFCDSAFAIGISSKGKGYRYLKQVKVRSEPFKYDSQNVLVCRLDKLTNFLSFIVEGYSAESEHLNVQSGRNPEWTSESIQPILEELPKEFKASDFFEEVKNTLGLSKRTAERILSELSKTGNVRLQKKGWYVKSAKIESAKIPLYTADYGGFPESESAKTESAKIPLYMADFGGLSESQKKDTEITELTNQRIRQNTYGGFNIDGIRQNNYGGLSEPESAIRQNNYGGFSEPESAKTPESAIRHNEEGQTESETPETPKAPEAQKTPEVLETPEAQTRSLPYEPLPEPFREGEDDLREPIIVPGLPPIIPSRGIPFERQKTKIELILSALPEGEIFEGKVIFDAIKKHCATELEQDACAMLIFKKFLVRFYKLTEDGKRDLLDLYMFKAPEKRPEAFRDAKEHKDGTINFFPEPSTPLEYAEPEEPNREGEEETESEPLFNGFASPSEQTILIEKVLSELPSGELFNGKVIRDALKRHFETKYEQDKVGRILLKDHLLRFYTTTENCKKEMLDLYMFRTPEKRPKSFLNDKENPDGTIELAPF